MKEQQLRRILDDIASQEIPADVDLWPAIRTRLPAASEFRQPARPIPRLGWTFLLVILGLVTGLTAYAMSALWGGIPFWRPVEEAGLGTTLHLSQTMNGYTVTLERAYADANQILIGFTVTGAENQRIMTTGTLRDAYGNLIPGLAFTGFSGQSDLLGLSLPPGVQAIVQAFDASALRETSPELSLRFEVNLVAEASQPQEPEAKPPDENTDGEHIILKPMPIKSVAGPFVFQFSVPFHSGRRVEVARTVTQRGVAITLQRVILTPPEARAILCYTVPGEEAISWVPAATLQGAGHRLEGSFSHRMADNCYRVSFLADQGPLPVSRPAEWILTVSELVGFVAPLSPPAGEGAWPVEPTEPLRLAGPWVFHFRTP
ncbi:MAG: DUF4179 domain-containing protein [Thermoflexales bacterium]|nr:DUF4179 domain-containing protein [Thermoflexales bacterium]